MESWQSSHIQRNLDFLISNTICGPRFLAILQGYNILSNSDVSKLEAMKDREGRFGQSKALYEILVTRTGAYNTLLEALQETAQTGSVRRLEQAHAAITVTFELKDINESTSWLELTDELKKEMRSKLVEFQGIHIQLGRLEKQYNFDGLDGKILVELAKGKIPCIVNNQVPEKLEYYVHRTITSRNKLKLDVLKGDSMDVFVIEGMEKHQLSSLLSGKGATDVSGNQLTKLTIRFILLQHYSDFQIICKLAGSRPVHWIKYENEKFELFVSSGSVINLQRYVDDSQESFLEDKLAFSSKKTIVIADSPGMGKTNLLTNIAHHIMHQKDVILVRFIVLKEFVDALNKKEINIESIVKAIAERSSQYEFGRNLVEKALQVQPCVLLFDGFDEVLSNQIPYAKKILQVAATKLSSTRIFVAARPHFRDELENTLHILGFTLQPFDEAIQINFLIQFWLKKGAIPNDSLTKFAKLCVHHLYTNMNGSEGNIAGIPLQCRMLGETYRDYAIRCSKTENGCQGSDSHSIVPIDSIFGMYEAHMDMRFEKISASKSIKERFISLLMTKKNRYKSIKQVHMYYALELLFPEQAHNFQYLNKHSIPFDQLCGLGILEATHSNDVRFVHRTFAEFLVAWFVSENKLNTPTFRDFVLSTIFKATKGLVRLSHPIGVVMSNREIPSFEFTFPVICHFINGFAKKTIPNNFVIKEYHKEIFPIYMSSAYHSFEYIPFAVALFNVDDKNKETESSDISDLLLITAQHSTVTLMNIFCSNFDIANMAFLDIKEKSDDFTMTPLHVAVQRGNYSLVEYLLNKFESRLPELRYLIHFCVHNSKRVGKAIVEEKIQIVKLLSLKSKEWIDEQLEDTTRTPLIQDGVPLELLECLLQEGADVNVIDKHAERSVLDKIPPNNQMTGGSYHRIVEVLNKHGFQHFTKPDYYGRTPLHCAVKEVELLPETLKLFLNKGIDLNAGDHEGDSVLFHAIRGRRSEGLIRELVRLGADKKHRNKKGENVLHICAKKGDLNAINYFIEKHNMDVNAQDNMWNTPLHLAMIRGAEPSEFEHQLLIESGGNVNAENKVKKTPFMWAFENGKGISLNLIKLMEEHGLNITPTIASTALKAVFLRFGSEVKKLEVFPEPLKYLMEKGGQLNFEFTSNIWKWEKVEELMQNISQHTIITTELLSHARNRGLLTERDCMGLVKLEECVKSKRFYEILQDKSGSFEQVFVILIENQQKDALDYLQKCLEPACLKLFSCIFITSNPGLKHLIFSETTQAQVIALESCIRCWMVYEVGIT